MKHEGKKPLTVDTTLLPGKSVSVTYQPGETIAPEHEALVGTKAAKKTTTKKKGGKSG